MKTCEQGAFSREAEWTHAPHQQAAPLPDQWCIKLRPCSCNRHIHLMLTCVISCVICSGYQQELSDSRHHHCDALSANTLLNLMKSYSDDVAIVAAVRELLVGSLVVVQLKPQWFPHWPPDGCRGGLPVPLMLLYYHVMLSLCAMNTYINLHWGSRPSYNCHKTSQFTWKNTPITNTWLS